SDVIDKDDVINFGDAKFGDFKWGEEQYKFVYGKCKYPNTELGIKFLYGDPLQQTILLNFYEKHVDLNYIKKQLAIKNREFKSHFINDYYLSPVILVLPFLNYSYNFDINQDDVSSGWTTNTTVTLKEESEFSFKYSNVNFTSGGQYLRKSVDLSTENKTGLSLLTFYIRVNTGYIRYGISDSNSFFTDTAYKKIFSDKNDTKWEKIDIFIDKSKIGTNSVNILFESLEDSTNIDIFGIELFNS